MRPRRSLAAVVGLGSLIAVQPAAAHHPSSSPVAGISAPGDSITKAPDGTMWLTEPAAPGRLAKVSSGGAVTEFTGGVTAGFNAGRSPDKIAATTDGYVFFLMHGGDEIGIAQASTGTIGSYLLTLGTPTSIAAGADGKVWMTADGDNSSTDFISRYNRADGSTLSYSTGFTAATEPRSIVATPDGGFAFVETAAPGRLGRIAADGTITLNSIGGAPTALGNGPTGALWFSRGADLGLLGAGSSTTLFPTGTTPTKLAAGPDDALWAATTGGVVRVAPDGSTTTYSADLDSAAKGTDIAAGPDGRMWMTLDRAPYLVRITVPPRVGATASSSASPTTAVVTTDIRPNGLNTGVDVQLRDSGGNWNTIGNTSVGDGLVSTPVRFDLDNLQPGTKQKLRVVATNDAGIITSNETEVTTASLPPATTPPVTTPPVTTPPVTTPDPTTPPVSTPPVSTPPVSTPLPTTPAVTTPAVTTPQPTTPAATTPEPTTPAPAQKVVVTTPLPAVPTAEPAPVQGDSVVVRPNFGTIRIRVPGSSAYREVEGAASIPTGSLIDTTKGSVTLSSRVNGEDQDGKFYGGEFKVKQVKATGMTQLYLSAPLDCPKTTKSAKSKTDAKASRLAAKKKAKRRHVWGEDDNGKFQTHGKDSVATVRGTKWLTTDTCAGTVVKVYAGAVSVAPRRGKGKAVLVKAGGRNFTRHTS